MNATLKDLCAADKQKVARLIQQVVEKERALRAAEAEAAARMQQLEGQNVELARENSSLRAKLSHAFALLQDYQHKCRVLEATVQLTGAHPTYSAPSSASPAPACDSGDDGVHAQLPLDGCEEQPASERERPLQLPAGASLPSTAAPSNDQQHQQPASSPGTRTAELTAAQPLPELHALKLLAQTLLEAHVELAVKQSQPQLPPPQQPAQQPERTAAPAPETCAAPSPATEEALCRATSRGAQGGCAVNATCISSAKGEAIYDERVLAVLAAVESMGSASIEGLGGNQMQETQGMHCYQENDLLELISML